MIYVIFISISFSELRSSSTKQNYAKLTYVCCNISCYRNCDLLCFWVVVCETIQLSRFPYSGYSVLFRKSEAFCFTQKYLRILLTSLNIKNVNEWTLKLPISIQNLFLCRRQVHIPQYPDYYSEHAKQSRNFKTLQIILFRYSTWKKFRFLIAAV